MNANKAPKEDEMSSARTVAFITISVIAAVAIGGIHAGMSVSDTIICGLIAGTGVALVATFEVWLFDRLGIPIAESPRLPAGRMAVAY
jgi:hypothetical protein